MEPSVQEVEIVEHGMWYSGRVKCVGRPRLRDYGLVLLRAADHQFGCYFYEVQGHSSFNM